MNIDFDQQNEKEAIELVILEKYIEDGNEDIKNSKDYLLAKYGILPKSIEAGLHNEAYVDRYVQEYLSEIKKLRLGRKVCFATRKVVGRAEIVLTFGLFPILIILLAARSFGPNAIKAYIGCGIYIILFILMKMLFERHIKNSSYYLKDIALVLESKPITTMTTIRYDNGSKQRFHTSEINIKTDLKFEICKALTNRERKEESGLFNKTSYFIAIDYLIQNYPNVIDNEYYLKKGIDALYLIIGFRPDSTYFRQKIIDYLIKVNEIKDAEKIMLSLKNGWPLKLTKEIQFAYIAYVTGIEKYWTDIRALPSGRAARQ